MILLFAERKEELTYFLTKIKKTGSETMLGHEVYMGRYSGTDIVLSYAESNMLSAAIMALLLEKYKFESIFVISGAVGLDKGMSQGDLFLATSCVLGGVNFKVRHHGIGYIPGYSDEYYPADDLYEIISREAASLSGRIIYQGRLLSSDVLIEKKEEADVYQKATEGKHFLAGDTISGGVYLIASMKDIPVVSLHPVAYCLDDPNGGFERVRFILEAMPLIGKVISAYLISKRPQF